MARIPSTRSTRLRAFAGRAKQVFRFRLRTLLLVIMLIGVVLGVHMRRKRFEHYVTNQIRPFGGVIFYDYQMDDHDNSRAGAPSPLPRWLAQFVGDDFCSRPAQLSLGTPEADDATIALIGQLTSLRVLILDCRCVTSRGLAPLGNLTRLRFLDLDQTPVDDDSIALVAGMKDLRFLGLERTRITDRALRHLQRCTSLKRLDIVQTPVSRGGYEALKRSLPNCAISWKHEDLADIEASMQGGLPCELIRKSRADNLAGAAH